MLVFVRRGVRGAQYLRYGLQVPVVLGVSEHLDEGGGRVDERVVELVLAGFDDADADVRVLAQARGEHQPGCAAADDHVVVVMSEEGFGRGDDGGEGGSSSIRYFTHGCENGAEGVKGIREGRGASLCAGRIKKNMGVRVNIYTIRGHCYG